MFLTLYRIALLLRPLPETFNDRFIDMSLHQAVSGDVSQWHLVLFRFFQISKMTFQVTIYYMDGWCWYILILLNQTFRLVELLTVQMIHCVMQTLGIFHIPIMNSRASLLYLFPLCFITPDIEILWMFLSNLLVFIPN